MRPKNKLPPWLRPKRETRAIHVGVGWYTAEEWAKVKSSAADPERFEETFAEWTVMAEQALEDIRRQGINVEKSFIVASELLAWCLATGKVNDASSRAEFVSQQDRNANKPAA
jgi:hypothetical protein